MSRSGDVIAKEPKQDGIRIDNFLYITLLNADFDILPKVSAKRSALAVEGPICNE